jgi:hypothetical protein
VQIGIDDVTGRHVDRRDVAPRMSQRRLTSAANSAGRPGRGRPWEGNARLLFARTRGFLRCLRIVRKDDRLERSKGSEQHAGCDGQCRSK